MTSITRVELIQYLIYKYKFQLFLEIGTQKGHSFLPIFCKKKIAVDPEFQIPLVERFKWLFRNFCNWNNSYFEMTSEDFFNNEKIFLQKIDTIDIVFIDGLHTFKGSLYDVIHSLKYLNKSGIIVMHDCFPPHAAAAIYAENAEDARIKGESLDGWTGEWCGDTWKTIAYLKKYHHKELEVFVLNSDYGLGIVKLKDAINGTSISINDNFFEIINKLTYQDLMVNGREILDLKEVDFYTEI